MKITHHFVSAATLLAAFALGVPAHAEVTAKAGAQVKAKASATTSTSNADSTSPPPPAAAPPAAAPPAAASATTLGSTDQARALFEAGVKYYNDGNYEKAHASFLEAYKLKPHPAVLLNVAQSALLAGNFAEAANQFSQYLDQTKGDPKQAPEAKAGFEEARAKSLGVAITVDASDATISVDGAAIGKSPQSGPYFVAPGSHKISAAKDAKNAEAQVTGNAGETTSANLTLATATQAAVLPEPDQSVQPEDGHGRKPFVRWFAETPVAWVGAGLSGLGLGGSLIFSLVAAGHYSNADDAKHQIMAAKTADGLPANAPPCGPPALDQRPDYPGQTSYSKLCSRFADQRDSGDSFKTISIVSLVVGVVAAGGTVAYYFVDPNAKESKESSAATRRVPGFQARLIPISTPTTQGLSLVGSF